MVFEDIRAIKEQLIRVLNDQGRVILTRDDSCLLVEHLQYFEEMTEALEVSHSKLEQQQRTIIPIPNDDPKIVRMYPRIQRSNTGDAA